MELTSRANPTIKHIRALGAHLAYRAKYGEFVCDGSKLLFEALKSKAKIDTLLYGDGLSKELLNTAKNAGVKCISVPDDLLCYAANLKTISDTVFTVKMDKKEPVGNGFCIMLDRVSDPGNVGTVIRTADAFGISAVILAGDCADVYSPKAVRASMGSIFRVPVIKCGVSEAQNIAASLGCRLAAAVLSQKAAPPESFLLEKICAVIGNESSGVCREIRDACEAEIYIPMFGQAESLNAAVAAGILAYSASLQKREGAKNGRQNI